jgi:hypothetical protein
MMSLALFVLALVVAATGLSGGDDDCNAVA